MLPIGVSGTARGVLSEEICGLAEENCGFVSGADVLAEENRGLSPSCGSA